MVKVNGLLGFCIGIIFGGIFVSIVVYYFVKEYCWKRACKKDLHVKRKLSNLRKRYRDKNISSSVINSDADAENKKQNERLV